MKGFRKFPLNLYAKLSNILDHINNRLKKNQKSLAVLIDPDKWELESGMEYLSASHTDNADFIFVGGSLLTTSRLEQTISDIKSITGLPIILFPGTPIQISNKADGILLLSLISGRNPDFLIGRHVESAFHLENSRLEIMPTSYLLVEGGNNTTVQYISNTRPIPAQKPELSTATALAGKQLGHKLTYLDSGSGAYYPVPSEHIKMVKKAINHPLIVGGGIRSAEELRSCYNSGADIAVIGNGLEENPHLFKELIEVRNSFPKEHITT